MLAGAALGLATRALPSLAQARFGDTRIFIPANPGGGWDLTGRALGQALIDARQSTRVTYENRGGAAGTIGLAQFATSYRGDPSALMVMGSVMLGGIITGKPPVGLDQVTPVARLTNEYNVFVLPPNSTFKNMAQVLKQFRDDPDSVKWGGGSRGSTEHIAIHLLAQALGVKPGRINYVPFRGGGEAAAAVMGGYVSVGGSGLSEFLPHLAAGRMRAVAVTSAQRLAGTDAPTLRELGVELVIGNWRGVCAPAGLDPAARVAVTDAVSNALASAGWQAAVRRHQWLAEPLTGPAFETFVASEFERMRDILVKASLA
ncbi:MAG: tripartite tricarboxylate transporter substrate binding protein [Hydrogenophaga sp.]|nr:tripartite tricarboxylate transporter substrate binding protein [Hydrogenophaga sp.]